MIDSWVGELDERWGNNLLILHLFEGFSGAFWGSFLAIVAIFFTLFLTIFGNKAAHKSEELLIIFLACLAART